MDYCHPCRRHLNGALACPGCGTPAHELHASGVHLTVGEEAPRSAGEAATADEEPREGAANGPDEGYDEDPGDAAPPGVRSSRRDRKAAAHRRRRRRTLLVTAGFVLAAGGLSLAELGMDAPHSPQKPAAAGGETADGGATREVGEASVIPADDTSRTTPAPDSPSASASASTTVSASPSESPEAEESGTASESGAPGASRAPVPTATRPPADPDPSSPESNDDPPPTTSPTPPDSPDPTPTETCDRFLWWCT
ncbi:SCO2400 family protein [Streptomyces coelicoflavus]|uniref:SCO2400 family protein n=1 Tax=Streptomyces coelicoflavus TaxID=285562 RepID=UPI00363342FF